MRWFDRFSVRFFGLGLALAVVALGASGCHSDLARLHRALEAESAYGSHAGLAGAWQVVASPQVDPQDVTVLVNVSSDGSVLVSDPSQSSTGIGVWLPTGPHRADLTYVTLTSGDDGTLITIKTSASVEYDPRTDTVTGEYTTAATDPDGTVIASNYGPLRGTRIIVDWPAMSDQAPAAAIDAPPTGTPAAEPTVTPAETPTAAAP